MKKTSILIIVFLLSAFLLEAQIPDRPNPPQMVNDYAGILRAEEKQRLESALVAFERETSTQIVVVAVKSLEGYDPGDFAFRLGEKWGIGQKDKNNGIVVLLKPKTQDSKGQVFIAPGYGLEGVLPDATVNGTIVDHEMIPRFRENDYFGGLAHGIQVMMDITKDEYTADQYRESVERSGGGGVPGLIVLALILFTLFGRSRRRRFFSPGRSVPFWLAMGMLSGSHRSSGSFSNFSSGSGSFGGFGGFGGGSFGGGGAGGSW